MTTMNTGMADDFELQKLLLQFFPLPCNHYLDQIFASKSFYRHPFKAHVP